MAGRTLHADRSACSQVQSSTSSRPTPTSAVPSSSPARLQARQATARRVPSYDFNESRSLTTAQQPSSPMPHAWDISNSPPPLPTNHQPSPAERAGGTSEITNLTSLSAASATATEDQIAQDALGDCTHTLHPAYPTPIHSRHVHHAEWIPNPQPSSHRMHHHESQGKPTMARALTSWRRAKAATRALLLVERCFKTSRFRQIFKPRTLQNQVAYMDWKV